MSLRTPSRSAVRQTAYCDSFRPEIHLVCLRTIKTFGPSFCQIWTRSISPGLKGHVNYGTAVGLDKIHAWFNHWADLAAKQALAGHDTPLFRHMVEDYKRMLSLAQDLYSFQAGVALIFANDGDAPEVNQQVRIGGVHPVGLLSSLWFEHDIHPVVCHQGFARSLINWMREIRWTSTTSVDGLGSLQDTS